MLWVMILSRKLTKKLMKIEDSPSLNFLNNSCKFLIRFCMRLLTINYTTESSVLGGAEIAFRGPQNKIISFMLWSGGRFFEENCDWWLNLGGICKHRNERIIDGKAKSIFHANWRKPIKLVIEEGYGYGFLECWGTFAGWIYGTW